MSKITSATITLTILSLSVLTGCGFLSSLFPEGTDTIAGTDISDLTVEQTIISESEETAATEETTEATTAETVDLSLFAEALITDLYNGLLGRDPDAGECDDLISSLTAGEIDPEDIVHDIINSSEFESLELTDEEFVVICISSLLDGYPSIYLTDYLTEKLLICETREEFVDFILAASPAFAEKCNAYGFLPQISYSVADPYEELVNAPLTDGLAGLGYYIPSEDALNLINETMEDFPYNISVAIIDISSGNGLVYNTTRPYYTASSIKGPYAASFLALAPETAATWETTIRNMLQYSDNDAYAVLNNTYRRTYIMQWCEEAGFDPSPCVYKYPRLTCVQMAQLWLRNYRFFTEDEYGQEVACWFQEPTMGVIRDVMGDTCITESKAGWIADEDPSHTTTCDAGIVHSEYGDYVVAIMTTAPSSFNLLRPVMEALDLIHQEM